MAAFDRINCGLPTIDGLLDNIRLGDNVVWQVTDLSEFRLFMEPFVRQAISDQRNLIYIRFAQHEPLLAPMDGLKIFEFDPDEGFEAFTMSIYKRITEEGRDAFYVFDSLSELQSVWYTDLMMGNFFRVTCPYLFSLDTVAYFPLLRGRHSFDVVARIRDTTQLLLDVYSNEDSLYLHPLKVWNRYSNRMFLPFYSRRGTGEFHVLEGGAAMSRYYRLLEEMEVYTQDLHYDSHDRFFAMAKLEHSQGHFRKETEQEIIESIMTKDDRLGKLIRKYFRPADYFRLRDRMIGSGCIGGKACGMLLARRICGVHIPAYKEHKEAHDSYYIGSDVFYAYIVENNCWGTRIAQRTADGYFAKADELKKALLSGNFPANIREQFRTMLEYFGQSPVIVRSSSFLEDGFGNAFAGKYESVFCVNQGTPEERLEAFEQAVRRVYASTMDISALEYRKQRGLQDKDEQMAVLVQRVSGNYFGHYFMPCAAGVGYSRCMYRWRQDMDPEAGMLRLVMGLGTRAVDRTADDYPRLATLDKPATSMLTSVAEKHRFSQRNVDVLDEETNSLRELRLEELLPLLPLWYKKQVLEHDYEAEYTLRNMGRPREVWFASCQRILENKPFTELMQCILHTLQEVYGNPVDIEYTVNLDEQGDFFINLLQCRTLYVGQQAETLELPDLAFEKTYFHLKDSSMGNYGQRKIDVVVQVEPKLYYEYPYNQKYEAVAAIRCINEFFKDSGKNLMLMVPGRIGTSSPELGVPVNFADISGFCAICEISDSRAGYMPDLSYGSHMFQDLVEADIIYGAIWNNAKTPIWQPDLLSDLPDLFPQICPQMQSLFSMFRVVMPEGFAFWLDAIKNEAICGYEL